MTEHKSSTGAREDHQTDAGGAREHVSRLNEQIGTDLPPVQQAILDAETLAALVRDLNECAQIDDVLLKGDAPTMIATSQREIVQLDDAVLRMQRGEVRGVQVRYRYDGQSWCDTLMHGSEGVRLTRIQHPSHP